MINREKILKNFLEKIRQAKCMNMSEIRISIKELDDISFIIYELMSEKLSIVLDKLETIDITDNDKTLSGGSF